MTERQALVKQRFHLQEACRHENRYHIGGVELWPVLLRGECFALHPVDEPIEDFQITVNGYVEIFELLTACDVGKVAHLGDEQLLRTREILADALYLIADVNCQLWLNSAKILDDNWRSFATSSILLTVCKTVGMIE